jgi:hypothetical protein
MISMSAEPRMNKDPAFLADKQRRVHDPQIAPLNLLVEAWRAEGRQVPRADPGEHERVSPAGLRPTQRQKSEPREGLPSLRRRVNRQRSNRLRNLSTCNVSPRSKPVSISVG